MEYMKFSGTFLSSIASLNAVLVGGKNEFFNAQSPCCLADTISVGSGHEWAWVDGELALTTSSVEVNSLRNYLVKYDVAVRQRQKQPLSQWLIERADSRARIGVCSKSWSAVQATSTAKFLEKNGFKNTCFVDVIHPERSIRSSFHWKNLKSAPTDFFLKRFADSDVESELITRGDLVSYLTGLRSASGGSVDAFLFMQMGKVPTLVTPQNIDCSASLNLQEMGYRHCNINEFYDSLSKSDCPVGIDPAVASLNTYMQLGKNAVEIKEIDYFSLNQFNLQGYRRVMRSFDAAVIEVLAYIECSSELSEISISDLLHDKFVSIPGFLGLSFPIYVSFGERTADPHPFPPATNKKLTENDIVMLDMGIHGESVTTDTTRMVVKTDNRSIRRNYTIILKAMAQASLVRGVSAEERNDVIESLVSSYNLKLSHSVGHAVIPGVSVHSFGKLFGSNGVSEIGKGIVFTIEPGVYFPGEAGFRLENLMVSNGTDCVPLTKIPIDVRPALPSMLTYEEIGWIDAYNRMSIEAHAETMSQRARCWSMAATKWSN